MSINELMGKTSVALVHDGLLVNLLKEKSPVVLSSMDETRDYFVKWKKPAQNDKLFYLDLISIIINQQAASVWCDYVNINGNHVCRKRVLLIAPCASAYLTIILMFTPSSLETESYRKYLKYLAYKGTGIIFFSYSSDTMLERNIS